MPEFIDRGGRSDADEWRGRPLFGHYEVDREGVVPKPLTLVEKGVLKNFLLTRQPVRGFRAPTAGPAAGLASAPVHGGASAICS